MPINIPSTDHEVYDRNFLKSVICQIRVPPIFKIGANEPPAQFQDQIRSDYPLVAQENPVQVEVKGGALKPTNLGNIWRFISNDHMWQVTLDTAFIALETKAYKSFTEFNEKFKKVYQAYNSIYLPARPERVGLRYINMIRPINVRSTSDWLMWIKPELFGLIGKEDIIREPILHDFKEFHTSQDPGSLIVKHGLMNDQEKQKFYLIDIDRFNMGARDSNEALGYLDRFHQDSYNFYNWAVGEECIKWLKGEI